MKWKCVISPAPLLASLLLLTLMQLLLWDLTSDIILVCVVDLFNSSISEGQFSHPVNPSVDPRAQAQGAGSCRTLKTIWPKIVSAATRTITGKNWLEMTVKDSREVFFFFFLSRATSATLFIPVNGTRSGCFRRLWNIPDRMLTNTFQIRCSFLPAIPTTILNDPNFFCSTRAPF